MPYSIAKIFAKVGSIFFQIPSKPSRISQRLLKLNLPKWQHFVKPDHTIHGSALIVPPLSDVQLTSCLTGLDSTKQVNHDKQSSLIQIIKTGRQPSSETSPYKVSEYCLPTSPYVSFRRINPSWYDDDVISIQDHVKIYVIHETNSFRVVVVVVVDVVVDVYFNDRQAVLISSKVNCCFFFVLITGSLHCLIYSSNSLIG